MELMLRGYLQVAMGCCGGLGVRIGGSCCIGVGCHLGDEGKGVFGVVVIDGHCGGADRG